MSDREVEAAVLDLLGALQPPALFVPELTARLRNAGVAPSAVPEALDRLAEKGSILVVEPPPPDPHLASMDLRIVASVPSDQPAAAAAGQADEAAQEVWERYLRAFLASHRCQ